jgi:hypothetical protein
MFFGAGNSTPQSFCHIVGNISQIARAVLAAESRHRRSDRCQSATLDKSPMPDDPPANLPMGGTA